MWRGKSSGLQFLGPGFSPQLNQRSPCALRHITSVLWVLDFTDGLDPSSSSVLWLYLSLSLSITRLSLKVPIACIQQAELFLLYVLKNNVGEGGKTRALRFPVNFYRAGHFRHVIMW